jgi:hypothetical protein
MRSRDFAGSLTAVRVAFKFCIDNFQTAVINGTTRTNLTHRDHELARRRTEKPHPHSEADRFQYAARTSPKHSDFLFNENATEALQVHLMNAIASGTATIDSGNIGSQRSLQSNTFQIGSSLAFDLWGVYFNETPTDFQAIQDRFNQISQGTTNG